MSSPTQDSENIAHAQLTDAAIEYRPMCIADYAAVMALWSNSSGLTMRNADSKQGIARYLQRNPSLSFVASVADELVGAVLAGSDGRRGYLQHLSVAEQWRGEGIGAALVDACTQALQQQGIDKTHLFVQHSNHAAKQFYERRGWQLRAEVAMYSLNRGDDANA